MAKKESTTIEWSDAAKKARSEYYTRRRKEHPQEYYKSQKKWRQKNPDKVREYHRRYWERRILRELAEQNKDQELTRDQRLDEMKTQGKKGLSLPRINLAFTPKNYEFLRVMYPFSHGKTRTMTGFVNFIIEQYRMKQENIDAYNEAKRMREEIE